MKLQKKSQMTENDYRIAVVQGAQDIFKGHLVEFGEGNVSMRVADQDELFITPTQNDYLSLTSKDIVHMKFDGTLLSKERKPSSEYRLHVAIYQQRPKATCVIHTHSIYASMFSMVKQNIPILFEEALVFLGGEIQVVDYVEAATEQLGIQAEHCMGETNGVIMENHGVVVCGRTMEYTVKNALLIEKMAKIYWGAKQLGNVHSVDKKYWDKFLKIHKSFFSTY